MDPKFKANGVLASAVDYFCLVCESRLYNETDAVSHIGKPVHIKNFELTNYFENRQDYVRKIKKWYFCELCNLLLSTATKVRLHVTEVKHIEYKNERLLERNGTFVVAFSNVRIHDKAWNGIIEETCVICNTEFENEKIHINQSMHIIKLIQSKTEFDGNNNLYRTMDDNSIQCLTCNIVVALNSLDAHFNLPGHMKLYQEAINSIQDTTSINSIQDTTLENDKKANNTKDGNVNTISIQDTILQNDKKTYNAKESKINKPIQDKILHNEKNVNSPKDENFNNKPNQDKILQNDKKTKNTKDGNVNQIQNKEQEKEVPSLSSETNIKKRVDEESCKKNSKAIKKSDEEICEVLDAKDYITKHNKNLWCILCHWELDHNTVKSHVNDVHHQTMLKLHKKRLSKLNADQITSLEVNNKIRQASNTNIQISEESVAILDSIDFFSKNGIQINCEIHTAFCVKCSHSLNFNKAFIDNHIKEHNENLKMGAKIKKDADTSKHNFEENENILDSIEIFQKNNIQINFEIKTAFCKKCSTLLDFKKNCIEEHIEKHTNAKDKISQVNSIIKPNNDQGNGIIESIDNFQRNNIAINFELQTAHCEKCSTSLDYNKAFIENHIKVHADTSIAEKKNTPIAQVTSGNKNRKAKTNKKALKIAAAKKTIQQQQSASYTEEDIKKIAEENDMTYTPNSREVHCNRCNTKIPSFPQYLHEHIEGSAHKAKVRKPDPATDKNKSVSKETINKPKHKVPIESFITSFVTIDGTLYKDIVINNRICINIFSFGLVRQAGNMLICEFCKTCEDINLFTQHLDSLKHKKSLEDSLVVDGEEFIREVRQMGFHCGYCDISQTSWESMESHLQSYVHRDSKTSSQWRLQQYLPHIEKHTFENRECFGFHIVFN